MFNKRTISIFLFLIFSFALSFSNDVYLQWRKIDSQYYFEKNNTTYIQLNYVAEKFGKVVKTDEDLVIIKHDKWKVFLFPKNKMCIINSMESFKFSDEDINIVDKKVYLTPQVISKVMNLDLISNAKGYYLNVPVAKIESINTIFGKSNARTIIELSEDANVEVYPLVNAYGYLIKIKGAEVPDSIYYHEYNNKVKYIKAYHFSETEVWVKIVLNYKSELKKTFESKRVILDFYFPELTRPVLVIDPGHGGHDSGAVGFNKLYEKTVALEVAKKVKDLLANEDIDVYLTRTKDEFIELYDRAMFANNKDADLFISIHLNSYPDDRTVNGSEIYYFDFSKSSYARRIAWKENLDSKKDKPIIETWVKDKESSIEESKKFANILENEIKRNNITDRGIHSAEFAVLAYTRCPAVLYELDFLSNKTVEQKFKYGTDYVKKFAGIIKESVLKYFKEKK
ncbi:hypothetical protein OSSY52_20990 [Tepiditoga spiralis]|uniref:MurNAc-LAA domain-containing protein n=1 Tax=Tepiditoga spiralis TaxID=2108365 RepID=A0A7G1G5T9_9BACT|nr:N-acetylmuramoyl-L-alanine amidase [Tepiditoga spiralis]BBE31958.1 hypothetical protein OSSY52_20990 [Tepiditoga spiralis]